MVPFVMAIVFIIVRGSNMSFNAHSAESVLTSKPYRMHHTVHANWTIIEITSCFHEFSEKETSSFLT